VAPQAPVQFGKGTGAFHKALKTLAAAGQEALK
jgi:hypothetical protein